MDWTGSYNDIVKPPLSRPLTCTPSTGNYLWPRKINFLFLVSCDCWPGCVTSVNSVFTMQPKCLHSLHTVVSGFSKNAQIQYNWVWDTIFIQCACTFGEVISCACPLQLFVSTSSLVWLFLQGRLGQGIKIRQFCLHIYFRTGSLGSSNCQNTSSPDLGHSISTKILQTDLYASFCLRHSTSSYI